MRPSSEHDTTTLREHVEVLPLLRIWVNEHGWVLGDLGYEGEADTITVAYKKPQRGSLSGIEKMFNKVHNDLRVVGERGNPLLKSTFKALRNVSLCPWTIGKITAAALLLPHREHDRTTRSPTATLRLLRKSQHQRPLKGVEIGMKAMGAAKILEMRQ